LKRNFKKIKPMKFTWTETTSIPFKISHHSVSFNSLDECLYITGGFNENFEMNSNFFRFNIQKKKFETFDHLSIILCGHSSLLYKNNLIIFGGASNFDFSNLISTDSFSFVDVKNMKFEEFQVKDAPPKRALHSCILNYKHEMIVFGGVNENILPLDDLHCFSFESKQWRKIYHQGFPRKGLKMHASQSIDHFMYVFGGISDKGIENLLLRFNFLTESFETIQFDIHRFPSPRFLLNSFTFDGLFYILGGENYSKVFSDVIAFNPLELKWIRQDSDLSEKNIRWMKCVEAEERIWMLGGISHSKGEQHIYVSCRIPKVNFIYTFVQRKQFLNINFKF
jgi:N-acetylneuraminic acid mutarotase